MISQNGLNEKFIPVFINWPLYRLIRHQDLSCIPIFCFMLHEC